MRAPDDLAQTPGRPAAGRPTVLRGLPQGTLRARMTRVPRLRLILGDQLQHDSPQLRQFDERTDQIVMIEAPGEAAHVGSHKARIALFLSAMRHYAAELRVRGFAVDYVALDDRRLDDRPGLVERLGWLLTSARARELVIVEPGEWRLAQQIASHCRAEGVALTVLADSHFMCSTSQFTAWAGGRRELRMEYFYRWMRRQHRVLLDDAAAPAGGRWNFDADNRSAFPRQGPGAIAAPAAFAPDEVTREVLALIERRFASHPGSLEHFLTELDGRSRARRRWRRWNASSTPG